MASRNKRTYSARNVELVPPSSPPSTLNSSPPADHKRKRSFADALSTNAPPVKKPNFGPLSASMGHKSKAKLSTTKGKQVAKDGSKGKQKQLTQLHFALETTTLRTCPLCDLTYTKGAPDDESLHRAHCARVQRGLEWGKEEERECVKANVEEVANLVKLKNGSRGRIICFRADCGGKIGAKVSILLETINLTLSSPPLSSPALHASKIYLFLLYSPMKTSSARREKIVGCVVAQRISTAMTIAPSPTPSTDISTSTTPSSSSSPSVLSSTSPSTSTSQDVPSNTSSSSPPTTAPPTSPSPQLIPVDPTTSLYVHPTPLPTPLGIPRLFVSSSHRRLGIASRLLTAAAENFIHGCPLDPRKGEVAFSQPTGAGKGVLEAWGGGGVRIFEEW